MRVENGVVGGGKKEDRVVGGVRGGGAKRGTNHIINGGNSRNIFVASPEKRVILKKITNTASCVNFFAFASMTRYRKS